MTLRHDAIIWAVAFGLVGLYALSVGFGFPLDDSWIHQTYARNLAWRGEWAFLPNQPSAASTSPLYTVLLAIGYALRLPYALWTHALGALALACAGSVGARMAAHLLPQARVAPLMVGLAIVSTWHLVWAGASGMETMLFGALCLGVMGLAWAELSPTQSAGAGWRGARFGVLVGLLTLARPEGIVLGGLAGLAVLTLRARWLIVWSLGAGLGFLACVAPYVLLNLQLTGGLLPNTAGAKFEQHAILLQVPLGWRIWDLVVVVLAGGHVLFAPTVVVYAGLVWRKAGRWLYLLPLLWCIALVLLYALRLPAAYQHGRYVMPLLPAWVFAGAVGLVVALRWGRYVPLRRVLTRTLALATVLTMGAFALGVGWRAYQDDVTIINEEMVASAFWIRDNLPQDVLLAIHDIGAVGYFSGRERLLDIAGLVSPEVVPIVANGDALWALMQAQSARYLMAFPDQIPNDNPNDPRLCEVFTTGGRMARRYGGANMSVYALAWDGDCQAVLQ